MRVTRFIGPANFLSSIFTDFLCYNETFIDFRSVFPPNEQKIHLQINEIVANTMVSIAEQPGLDWTLNLMNLWMTSNAISIIFRMSFELCQLLDDFQD